MRQLQQFFFFFFSFFFCFFQCFRYVSFALVSCDDALIRHVHVVHAHLGKVLEHNVIVIVLVVTLDVAMLLNGLHLLHGIRALLLDGA